MTTHSRMHKTVALCLALFAGGIAYAQSDRPIRYDGHKSVRVTVTSPRELMTVRALADDILTCEGSGLGTFDVRMSPERYAAFATTGIAHRILILDMQASLDQIWADDARIRREQEHQDDPAWFATYRSLAELEARMQHYATNYSALATLSTIGTSVQNRPIKMLRITGPGATTNRPAFVIQANQHAREWITPHAAMYIIDRFCETYTTDSRIQNLVNNLDFYIIVSANPDGYEYSRNTDPQWRKNRRDNPGTSCEGVDLNRNWGFQWGFDNLGSSPDPCFGDYRGPAAWSEPEIAGLRTLLDSLRAQQRLAVFWDIHSNGQLILSAWGYTTQLPPDLPQMNALGAIIQAGMYSVRSTTYPYGPSAILLYLVNGGARDYAYGTHGIMAWTIEMGGSGFMPPVGQILPLAQEALAGLLPLAEEYVPPICYPNCDGSTLAPILNINDFQCFLARFAASDPYANCDGSTAPPTLNISDFICFLNKYAAGCS